MHALLTTRCPLCGNANQCAPAQTGTLNAKCWCSQTTISAEALARIPADLLNKACLCPCCAALTESDMADPAAANQP